MSNSCTSAWHIKYQHLCRAYPHPTSLGGWSRKGVPEMIQDPAWKSHPSPSSLIRVLLMVALLVPKDHNSLPLHLSLASALCQTIPPQIPPVHLKFPSYFSSDARTPLTSSLPPNPTSPSPGRALWLQRQ